MPLPGRKPKPAGQAVNRNKPTHDYVEVLNVPAPGRPLPDHRPDGKGWSHATRAWWSSISTMPHTVLWTEGDWQYAYDTAFVAAKFHAGDLKAATELRNREKVMGTTIEYRLGLRIRYVDPVDEDETPAEVTRLDDFRDL